MVCGTKATQHRVRVMSIVVEVVALSRPEARFLVLAAVIGWHQGRVAHGGA